MSVNSYLTKLANSAIVRDQERVNIQRSIDTLSSRLENYFPDEITNQFVFGSYSRGTILPRYMDSQSDVDYMVVFSDSSYRPQTYLDRLQRFAEYWYGRSEIAQSHPTIVLELNHIRFELVPAILDWFDNFKIPAKASAYQDWLDTDPKKFNERLTSTNQANGNLIKPLVRVIKYWNAEAGYPFESFNLEQKVVNHLFSPLFSLLVIQSLDDLFFQFVKSLDIGFFAPQWKQDAVSRLKQLSNQANIFEKSGNSFQAEEVIKRLMPPVGSLLGI